jgi:amino acid transporter
MGVVMTAVNVVTLRGSSITAIVPHVAQGAGARRRRRARRRDDEGQRRELRRGRGAEAGLGGLVPVLFAILWTYDGWADVSSISGEVIDPAAPPRILLMGLVATIGVYLAVNAVYFSLVPIARWPRVRPVARS